MIHQFNVTWKDIELDSVDCHQSFINVTWKEWKDKVHGFLITAKKKVGSKTSYYLVSLDSDPQDDRGKCF